MFNIQKKIKTKLFLYSVKCIIWDYDGTLYNDQDTKKIGESLKKVFFHISKKYKPNLTLKNFEKKSQILGSWAAASNFYSNIPIMNLLDSTSKKINKEKYIKSNPKIVNLIESTKDKYIHLILTNSTSKEVLYGLSKIGFINNPFKKIFSRDITKKLKPDPNLFKEIQQFTKLNKRNILCIGDSLFSDIKPAIEYGFKAIPIWKIDSIIKIKNKNLL